MADTENDILIDGKSIYSLRVVDLKQELKKRDIPFKTNATKAQLQSLLIPHLSQTVDAIEDKSSEDNSRLTTHSEDTNETIESNPEVINTNTIDDNKPNDVQTEATDLSQDSGITSSVSFGDRQSIKLTIKLGPNDSPIKQLSPKKSPTKEMRSPVIVEEVKTMIEEIKTKPIDVIPDVVTLIEDQGIPKTESTTKVETLPVEDVIEQNNESNSQVKSPQKSDNIEEKEEKQEIITEVPKQEVIAEVPKQEVIAEVPKQEVIAEVPKQEVIAEVPKQEVIAEVPKQEVIAEVPKQEVIAEVPKQEVIAEVPKQEVIAEVPKPDEIVESIPEIETSKPMDLSSVDSNELQKKPEEKTETIEDNLSIPVVSNDKEVVSDTIVISEEISEELAEQKTEPSISSSEKESLNSVQSSSEDKAKDLPSDESLISTQSELNPQKEDIIEKKSVGKENKIEESEDKPEIIEKPEQPKEEKPKPPRRRRWGGSTANETQQNTRKGISSDQLKDLIPDLNSADNSNTASKVSKSDSIVVTSSLSRTQTAEEITEIPAKRDIRVVRKSVSVAEEQTSVTEETVKIPQTIVEQKAKIVVESEPEPKVSEAEVIREVSPPQKAESNIVFIRNLVRPFTLLQLKEVLGKTGKLTEERFWIDKIKSKCFASYQTNEEAVATRLALHGTRWPSSNPKLLIVDFATKEELDSHLEPDLNKDITNKKTDNEVNQKYDIVIRSEEQRNVLREKDNRNENRPIREWDREKLVNKEDDKKARRRPNSPITRSRSRERDPKRRRIGEERVRPADSTSEEAPATEAVKRTESPAKLLDDLFRKTTATPSIYWLPLTEEQALARVVIREEEEKKRAEERTAREEQFRKRQEDRRPFEANSPPFRNERNQWRPDSSPNRRMFGRRGSAPRRSPPGRRSPPRRRSPVNRFSRSRSRSPFPRRKR